MKTRLKRIEEKSRELAEEISLYLRSLEAEKKAPRPLVVKDSDRTLARKIMIGRRYSYSELLPLVMKGCGIGYSKAKVRVKAWMKHKLIERVGVPRSPTAYYRISRELEGGPLSGDVFDVFE